MAHDRRDRCRVHLLWGRSDRFPRPQLITAFSDGLVDACVEEHHERREEAIDWFLGFGDNDRTGWTFWETVEQLLVTVPTLCILCRRPLESGHGVDQCVCEVPEARTTCECNPRGGDGEHTRYCPRYLVPA